MIYRLLILLSIFYAFTVCSYANSSNVENTRALKNWKISTPASVAQQANKYNTGSLSDGIYNPTLSPALDAFSNMLQRGYYYGGEEKIRQQKDFVRQQMEIIQDEE